jgi:hypothetical protein
MKIKCDTRLYKMLSPFANQNSDKTHVFADHFIYGHYILHENI